MRLQLYALLEALAGLLQLYLRANPPRREGPEDMVSFDRLAGNSSIAGFLRVGANVTAVVIDALIDLVRAMAAAGVFGRVAGGMRAPGAGTAPPRLPHHRGAAGEPRIRVL